MRRLKLLAMILAACLAAPPALADLLFPVLAFRTGPYASIGTPLADGYADYFTLLNERDGGINGMRVQAPECETGYATEKGVECYEALKGLAPALLQPLSTSIALQIAPRAAKDAIPVHAMGHGRSIFADGSVFPWMFAHPATYWDALSVMVGHMLEQAGGKLAGRRIGLIYHNSAYGREPIPLMRELARKHRFALRLYPVEHPGQEQKAAWAKIGEDRPDFLILWGWGVMNEVALESAAALPYPMSRIIGNWWTASEPELIEAGEAVHGYKVVTLQGAGTEFPLFDDLATYVHAPGKAAGDGTHMGRLHYNLGLHAAMLAAEAARTAMRLNDTPEISPAMMRDGLEALSLDENRLRQLGLAGFAPELANHCANHGGAGGALIHRWDAHTRSWRRIGGVRSADRELVWPLIREEATRHAVAQEIEPVTCTE